MPGPVSTLLTAAQRNALSGLSTDMDAIFGLPGSAPAQRRRRLAAAAVVGLATYVLWRASRKDSTARRQARVIMEALQRRTGVLMERGAECMVAGAVAGFSRAAAALIGPTSSGDPASPTFPARIPPP